MAITEIKDTDKLIDSVSVLNNNFNSLDNDKANSSDVYTKTEIDDGYLKLSGGTMSGNLAPTSLYANRDASASGYLAVGAGSGYDKGGGSLVLYGAGRTDSLKGAIALRAQDGTNLKQLQLYPNGTLTWAGVNVALSNTFNTSYSQVNSSDVSVATGTITNTQTVTITKGLWLIQVAGHFVNNSTGYRSVGLATNTTSVNMDRFSMMRVSNASGNHLDVCFTEIINITTTSQKYYINVYQNSGSALTCNTGYRLVKLA